MRLSDATSKLLIDRSELDVVRAIVSWLKSFSKNNGSNAAHSGNMETSFAAADDDPVLILSKRVRAML